MQYGSMQDAENQVKFYYDQYHGHAVHKIEAVHEQLRSVHKTVVFFAGDSSLDNKYWVDNVTGAINGYEKVLPDMKQVSAVVPMTCHNNVTNMHPALCKENCKPMTARVKGYHRTE